MPVPLSVSRESLGMHPTTTQISPQRAVQRSAMRCSTSRQTPRLRAGLCGVMLDMRKVFFCASSPKRETIAWFGAMCPRS